MPAAGIPISVKHYDTMLATTHYYLEEPQTVAELEALLRLRYRVFKAHPLGIILPDNAHELDVDAWDKYAWHFGLYRKVGDRRVPVGYLRAIRNLPKPAALLLQLGEKYPALRETICAAPPAPFPFLKRLGSEVLTEWAGRVATASPGVMAEVSRFAMLGGESRAVNRFFIEAVIAVVHLLRVSNLVFQAKESHLRFYQAYGYQPISRQLFPELPGEKFFLIRAHRTQLTADRLPVLRAMAESFQRTGILWLKSQPPVPLPAPAPTSSLLLPATR